MTNKIPENIPDSAGKFGDYGGKFVPETLMTALTELEQAYNQIKDGKVIRVDTGATLLP